MAVRWETDGSWTRACLPLLSRPPAVQLHLRADRRDAGGGVFARRLGFVGASAAAAGHRLHGSAARRPYPPLQSDASQTGRQVAQWAHRKEGPVRITGSPGLQPSGAPDRACVHVHQIVPFRWSI